MFKNIIFVASFALMVTASSAAVAAEMQVAENTQVVLAEKAQPTAKNESTETLNGEHMNEMADSGTLSPSATGWMLALALVGFVMLSNRRAI